MVNDTIELGGVRLTWRKNDYVVDFSAQFEVDEKVDTITDIYGEPVSQRITQNLFFRQITIKSVIDLKSGIAAFSDGASWMNMEIEEVCLDWCETNDELKMVALAQYNENS